MTPTASPGAPVEEAGRRSWHEPSSIRGTLYAGFGLVFVLWLGVRHRPGPPARRESRSAPARSAPVPRLADQQLSDGSRPRARRLGVPERRAVRRHAARRRRLLPRAAPGSRATTSTGRSTPTCPWRRCPPSATASASFARRSTPSGTRCSRSSSGTTRVGPRRCGKLLREQVIPKREIILQISERIQEPEPRRARAGTGGAATASTRACGGRS